MATFFAMPKLGLNMTQGIIVGWLAKEGDVLEEGTPLLEVETDKAIQEIGSPVAGVLAKIIKEIGDEVPCNHILAVITEPGEEIPNAIPTEIAEGIAPTSEVGAVVQNKEQKGHQQKYPSSKSDRINISPSAKKLAQELGVDIKRIDSGGERIKREDVEDAYNAMQSGGRGTPDIQVSKEPMSSMRRKIAENMDKSARSVARVGLTLEVDMTNIIQKRESTLIDKSKISYNVFLVKLIATALSEFPYMNAQISGNEIWIFEDVNVGIAIDSKRGLLVPVLKQANKKTVEELHQEFVKITGRAVEGKSSIEDLDGGTFTITNLGNLDIEEFLPIINVPECAILGVGAIIEKPVAQGGVVVIQPRMKITLAFDHRLVDGVPAARFLQRLKVLIEEMP